MEELLLGGSNSMVESQPSKLLVAGSIPVSRSIFSITCDESDASRLSLKRVTSVLMLSKPLKRNAPARMIDSLNIVTGALLQG